MEVPHLFNLLVLLLWHECLRWHERGTRPWPAIVVLVCLMAAWAGLNGEILAGLIVLAAYGIGAGVEFIHADNEHERQTAKYKTLRLSGAGLLCVGAAGLHPAGYKPLSENIRLLFLELPKNWPGGYDSMDFQSVAARGFLVWLAVGFLWSVWQRPRLTPGAALVLVGWIGLALYARRYIPFMVVLTVPILAQSVSRKWAVGWGALAVGVLLMGLPPAVGPVPAEAVQFIRAHPAEFAGRMFNHPTWGGYLMKELPGRRVVVGESDSIRLYRQIANLSTNWWELLERSDVGWTLMPRRHWLNQGLRELPSWRCAYSDEVAVVYWRLP